jgi:hypothetical protein
VVIIIAFFVLRWFFSSFAHFLEGIEGSLSSAFSWMFPN